MGNILLMHGPRIILLAIACLFLAGAGPCFPAGSTSEAEIKAAAITNFLLFTRWPIPPQRAAPLQLCFFANESLGSYLDNYIGMEIQGAILTFRRIGKELGSVASCHAVYIGNENPLELPRVSAATRDQSILIIAEGTRAMQEGGMIAISVAGPHIVFDINIAAVRAANLTLSAKLLRLARSIVE